MTVTASGRGVEMVLVRGFIATAVAVIDVNVETSSEGLLMKAI